MKLKETTSNFFLKNWRMRILSARIFGGKIEQFLNRCYREAFFKRLAHAYWRIVQSFKTKIKCLHLASSSHLLAIEF